MYIYNEKPYLFQWDLNQEVVVEDAAVKYVHFSNASGLRALVVEVVNGKANIPNILLQEAWDIKAYGFCGECVRESLVINVKARTKPDDYIYTETECKTWDEFEQRITALEENMDETVINAIVSYLEQNPIQPGATEEQAAQIEQNKNDIQELKEKEVDLTGYATEEYVTDQIGSITHPEEIYVGSTAPTDENIKLWVDPDAEPTTKYATEEYVNAAVGGIDLSEYAKKSDIPDTSNFALKSDIPDVSSFMDADEVAAAINQALGVIENGTY